METFYDLNIEKTPEPLLFYTEHAYQWQTARLRPAARLITGVPSNIPFMVNFSYNGEGPNNRFLKSNNNFCVKTEIKIMTLRALGNRRCPVFTFSSLPPLYSIRPPLSS